MGCEDHSISTPKPRAYPKITYPERAYQDFDNDFCKFTFKYPVYAEANRDTLFFDKIQKNQCWFDLDIEQFAAKLHCTYYPVGVEKTFEELRADAFTMAQKHNVKAAYIQEQPLDNGKGATGFLFSLEGEVATPLQFYLTDEKEHFLRGALYFRSKVQPDSLAPIFKFLRTDVEKMIETFRWE